MIVADTDVLIDALRGRSTAEHRITAEIRARALATTVITAFELLSGARRASEQEAITKLLRALTLLPLDLAAAERSADLRRSLESRGEGIGTADYLIAGICLERGHTLLSRNARHFSRVPDLDLEILV